MIMFHLKHPQTRGFLGWEELGCLARALGFRVDLFKSNLNDEVEADDNGLSHQAIKTMIDFRLLDRSMHHTANLHTADWNICVLLKAVQLLQHKVIDYEELNKIRIAYEAYENGDMKGMMTEEQVLLRSLKMCGWSIAPMKLTHRVKHMKADLEEKGRIQLYEFLDLILWCHVYQGFSADQLNYAEGKEREIFKLVEFEHLLSHHDQRLADQLNDQYLREEWDFGHESLGSKKMFRDPPVGCAEERIQAARYQKRTYRHLKSEVFGSQKTVYQAQAGFIRNRPLTAPDLSMYQRHDKPPEEEAFTAHTAYQSVQKILRAGSTRETTFVDMSDRPQMSQYQRGSTPKVVTPDDIGEAEKKFRTLQFDMETLEGRCEINMHDEMDAFLSPTFKEKWLNRPRGPPPTSEPQKIKKKPAEEIIHNLVYPPSRFQTAHTKSCDARFRGWYNTKSTPGSHYILISPSFDNSPQGRLFLKMHQRAVAQVKNVRDGDYLQRYTWQQQTDRTPSGATTSRPFTAPAWMENKEMTGSSDRQISAISIKTDDTGYSSSGEDKKMDQEGIKGSQYPYMMEAWKDTGRKSPCAEVQTETPKGESDQFHEKRPVGNGRGQYDVLEPHKAQTNELEFQGSEGDGTTKHVSNHRETDCGHDGKHVSTLLSCENTQDSIDNPTVADLPSEVTPVPFMEHSKPKVVSVGSIGKISLLENISESRFWEDMFNKEDTSKGESKAESSSLASADSGQGDENLEADEINMPADRTDRKEETEKLKANIDQIMRDRENRLRKQKRLQGPRVGGHKSVPLTRRKKDVKMLRTAPNVNAENAGVLNFSDVSSATTVAQSGNRSASEDSNSNCTSFKNSQSGNTHCQVVILPNYSAKMDSAEKSDMEATFGTIATSKPFDSPNHKRSLRRLALRGNGSISKQLKNRLLFGEA